MNYKGEVTTSFGDGEYTFKLTVSGILELQDKCGAGFAEIYARALQGRWDARDVYEALRLGLIGAGMKPTEAKKLVDGYLLPLAESAPISRLVLSGVMFGFENSPVGKTEAAASATAETTKVLTPQPSSETPASSGSAPMSLDEFLSMNLSLLSRPGTQQTPLTDTSPSRLQ